MFSHRNKSFLNDFIHNFQNVLRIGGVCIISVYLSQIVFIFDRIRYILVDANATDDFPIFIFYAVR